MDVSKSPKSVNAAPTYIKKTLAGVHKRDVRFAIAFIVAITTACAQAPKHDAAQSPKRDTPIGTILRDHAVQRSLEQCKAKNVVADECSKSLANAQQHLDAVNARIEALLKDPRTNGCDLVRFVGSCNNPGYSLDDLADCLQVAPDRAIAHMSLRWPRPKTSASSPPAVFAAIQRFAPALLCAAAEPSAA
jgi:hypothetical protein